MAFKTAQTPPTRWGVINEVLSNKKAMDEAFKKYRWEMQREAQKNNAGADRDKRQHEYRMEEQGLRNENSALKPHDRAAQFATQILARNGDLVAGSPEYMQKWQEVFNTILPQVMNDPSSQGAANLAGGFVGNPTGVPFDANMPKPSLFANPFGNETRAANPSNPIDALAGKITGKGKPGSKAKAKAGAVSEGMTATNPRTGQKLRFQGGQWIPIQ